MSIRRIGLGDGDGGDSEKNLGLVIRTINNTKNISIMREGLWAGALMMYLDEKQNASALLFDKIYHISHNMLNTYGIQHFPQRITASLLAASLLAASLLAASLLAASLLAASLLAASLLAASLMIPVDHIYRRASNRYPRLP